MNLSRAHGCRLVMFLESNYRADKGRLETSCQWPMFFEVFYPNRFFFAFSDVK